jgi:hypothetical protein
MPDYYLRADTQQEIENKLIGSGLAYIAKGADGYEWLSPSAGVVIDHLGPYIVGKIEFDENGNPIQPTVKDNRWHTNIRTKFELNEAQKSYLPLIDPPTTPNRIFA